MDKVYDSMKDRCPECGSDDLLFKSISIVCIDCKSTFDHPTSKRKKWDLRFLALAKHISSWSLDPSTKVGAVIVDQDKRIVSVGYNGFAAGVKDDKERYNNREKKYKFVVHGEMNALLFAQQSLKGCTLYTTPFMSCPNCASAVVQKGITRCVAPELPDSLKERWEKDLEITKTIFYEAEVELCLYKQEELLEI